MSIIAIIIKFMAATMILKLNLATMYNNEILSFYVFQNFPINSIIS